MSRFRQAAEAPDRNRSTGSGPWHRGRREILVSVLVIGSLMIAVGVSVVVGADRPYPGVALGSGLLLELERAVAVWAVVLLALVVGDQALRGRLPDEIGGRGVRYAAEEQVDEVADANGALSDRVEALEVAFDVFERRIEGA